MTQVPGGTAVMTPERLAEIEKRCAAATPGPWHEAPDGFGRSGKSIPTVYAADDELRYIARCSDFPFATEHATDNVANMRFIANARQDIPDLLAEVRRLNEELRDACTRCGEYAAQAGHAQGELLAIGWQGGPDKVVEGFREENERLRAELSGNQSSLPRWHDRPTGPGVWCGAINVFTISQRALELMQARGDDWWRVGRVYGPIPNDEGE